MYLLFPVSLCETGKLINTAGATNDERNKEQTRVIGIRFKEFRENI